jgi:hypothetical protein
MKAQTLNTQEAPTKWWAARDAQMRNAVNATLHTDKDKLRAERMKMALELCYGAKGFYISYGKRGISVKVDKVTAVRNRKQLRALEADWDLQGVVKKESAQGVIYRF